MAKLTFGANVDQSLNKSWLFAFQFQIRWQSLGKL